MSIDPSKAALTTEEAAPITSFVAASPNSNYILNERNKGQPLVDVCRVAPGGAKDCIEVFQDVTKVFALMQKQSFFCQLPASPSHTEIECIRIAKIVERQS